MRDQMGDAMRLRYPVDRSTAAFMHTVKPLFGYGKVYFWTFTFKKCLSDDGAMFAWQLFLNQWRAYYEGRVCGVRVVEVHAGGHGLHFHCLITCRCSIHIVKRIACRFGFGRIGVVEADEGSMYYLALYLRKEREKMPGRRTWAAFGAIRTTRVHDVEVISAFHNRLRCARRAKLFAGQGRALSNQECQQIFRDSQLADFDWSDKHYQSGLVRDAAGVATYYLDQRKGNFDDHCSDNDTVRSRNIRIWMERSGDFVGP